MKRLTSICLFFVVIAVGLWPNEQPKWTQLLTSLESERRILTLSINSIENELNITKRALSDLKSEYSQMESAFSEQRQLLGERKTALEERKSELEKAKALSIEHAAALKLRERQLSESDQSLTNLELSFDDYQRQAESDIQTLETVIIVVVIVAAIGTGTGIVIAIIK